MMNLREIIRSSSDLKNHYNEISKQCNNNKKAVIITVNGKGDTVSLGYKEYQNIKAKIELLELLSMSDEDVINNRISPITDTFDDLRELLEEL